MKCSQPKWTNPVFVTTYCKTASRLAIYEVFRCFHHLHVLNDKLLTLQPSTLQPYNPTCTFTFGRDRLLPYCLFPYWLSHEATDPPPNIVSICLPIGQPFTELRHCSFSPLSPFRLRETSLVNCQGRWIVRT